VQLLSYYGLDLSIAASIVVFYRLTSTWFSTSLGIYPSKAELEKEPCDQENNCQLKSLDIIMPQLLY
jgi:hypothetical protein